MVASPPGPNRGSGQGTTRSPPDTRTRILDAAQAGVVAKGFDATSIDEIVAEVGLSRAGFFSHFPDKSALALALLQRYAAEEDALFDALQARAADLSDDPLQQLLIFLRLLAETLADMPNGHPGCIVATAAYQDRLFDRAVGAANRAACLNWRQRLRAMLDRVPERTPPVDPVDLDDLADTICTTVEGGIVMAKAMADPGLTSRQVLVLLIPQACVHGLTPLRPPRQYPCRAVRATPQPLR